MLTPKLQLLQIIQGLQEWIHLQMQAGEQDLVCVQPLMDGDQRESRPNQAAMVRKPANNGPAAPMTALEKMAVEVSACQKCALGRTRQQAVFGDGDPQARLVFVGEAPGAEEDRQGLPFVGEAGKLLTRMLGAIGLERAQVYICNTLKCRPPGNRNPLPSEIDACRPYLNRQLQLLKPELICALGTFAAQTLLATQEPIGRVRGKIFTYQNIPVIPTFHPAALLYHPQNKRLAWEDMKLIARQLGLEIKST